VGLVGRGCRLPDRGHSGLYDANDEPGRLDWVVGRQNFVVAVVFRVRVDERSARQYAPEEATSARIRGALAAALTRRRAQSDMRLVPRRRLR
jgi:hypothetical protein